MPDTGRGEGTSQELGCVVCSTQPKARPWWKQQGSMTREKDAYADENMMVSWVGLEPGKERAYVEWSV